MFLLWLAAARIQAADTGIEGSIGQDFYYDDNFLMQADAQGTWAYVLLPSLTGYYRTPVYTSSLTAGLTVNRYTAFSDRNSENEHYLWQQDWSGERQDYRLATGYTVADLREEADEDTGDFATRNSVETFYLRPGATYQLTEKDALALSADYTDKRYEQITSDDNWNLNLGASWNHALNERLSTVVQGAISRFESEGVTESNVTDYLRLTSGFSYQITELLSVRAQLGASSAESRVRGDAGLNRSRSNGALLSAALDYTTELNSLSLSLSRDLSPGSGGAVNEQDRVSFSWSRHHSERTDYGVAAGLIHSQAADSDRLLATVSPFVRYSLTPDLAIRAGFAYRGQKERGERYVESNKVLLQLNYQY